MLSIFLSLAILNIYSHTVSYKRDIVLSDKNTPIKEQYLYYRYLPKVTSKISSNTNNIQVVFHHPRAGFSNTVMCLLSSYALALIVNADLVINDHIFNGVFDIYDYQKENEIIKKKDVYLRPCRWKIKGPIASAFRMQNCSIHVETNERVFKKFHELGYIHENKFNLSHSMEYGFDVMANILKDYIHFLPRYYESINSMYNNVNWNDVIGFHIRMGSSKSDASERANFIWDDDIAGFVNCKLLDFQGKSIFVASDSLFAKERVRNLTTLNVLYSNKKAHHSKVEIKHNNLAKSTSFDGVVQDILILSKCQHLIVTKGSSMSLLAALLQGSIPLYITRNTTCYYPKVLETDVRQIK